MMNKVFIFSLFSLVLISLISSSLVFAGMFIGHVVDGDTGSALQDVLVTYDPAPSGGYLIDQQTDTMAILPSGFYSINSYIAYSQIDSSNAVAWAQGSTQELSLGLYNGTDSSPILATTWDPGDEVNIPGTNDKVTYDSVVSSPAAFPEFFYPGSMIDVDGAYAVYVESVTTPSPYQCNVQIIDIGSGSTTSWSGGTGDSTTFGGGVYTLTVNNFATSTISEACQLTVTGGTSTVYKPQISLYSTDYAAVTDLAGDFKVNNLNGYYTFTFSKTDYEDLTIGTIHITGATNYDYSSYFGDIKMYKSSSFPSSGSGPGSIAGVVTDGTNIIGGATVQAYLGSVLKGSDTTDAVTGEYNISVDESGMYVIKAVAPGYSQGSTTANVDITTDPHVTAPDIVLSSGGTVLLDGHVTDYDTGSPLAGVDVEVTLPDGSTVSDTTDGTGYYSFSLNPNIVLQKIEFSLSGYQTKGFINVYVGPTGATKDAILQKVSGSGTVSGYVTDSVTGDPIEGATVTNGTDTVYTDATGYYTFDLPAGSATITYSASGYNSTNVSITVPVSGTITQNVALDPIPMGWVYGYVKSNSGSPLSGATLSSDGYTTTTNGSGFYNLTLPEGSHVVTASYSGYDSGSATVTIVADTGVGHNFTLSRSSTDDGGSSGGSGSSTGGGVTSTPPTTYTTSGQEQTSSFEEQGLTVERQIIVQGNKTRVIITITNHGDDVGPFELREHPPSYIDKDDITYTLSPYEVVDDPLTLVWRFNGLSSGKQIVFAYDIGKVYRTLSDDQFDASIYMLSASVPTPKPVAARVVLTAPAKAFVGDTITLSLTDEDGQPLANQEITVISPYHNTYSLVTGLDGKVRFTLEIKGTYKYSVPGMKLVDDVSTEVVEKGQVVVPKNNTETNITITGKPKDTLSNIMGMIGSSDILLPTVILLFVGGILAVLVGAYLGYEIVSGGHSIGEDENEDNTTEDSSIVVETGVPESDESGDGKPEDSETGSGESKSK